jgi:hypothetical protein
VPQRVYVFAVTYLAAIKGKRVIGVSIHSKARVRNMQAAMILTETHVDDDRVALRVNENVFWL